MTLFDERLAEDGDADAPEQRSDAGAGSVPARSTEDTVRLMLVVAYDGGDFHGWWPNEGVRTVGATLQEAIERVVGSPVAMTCAGRTDAGVHAHGQVVTLDVPTDGPEPDRLKQSVNRLLGPEIVVRSATTVADHVDARHSATARCYRYTILNRPEPDPFLAATAWHVPAPLDLRAMRLARDPFIGEHDFTSFCRRPKGEPDVSLTRRIVDASWHDLGDDVLRFDIEANAFCHQMVRSVVGTLVDVGRGRLRAGQVSGILRARDREAAGQIAPPHGLTLWHVRYD